jgi:hypothetical protein
MRRLLIVTGCVIPVIYAFLLEEEPEANQLIAGVIPLIMDMFLLMFTVSVTSS